MVAPDGPVRARSGSTWIHWWSPVASANRSTRSWVTGSQSLYPRCSPTALVSSVTSLKIRMSVRRPAGHVDDLARDERGAVAHQVRDGVRDVLGPPDPADRDGGRGLLLHVLERDAQPLRGGGGHVGDDEPGRHRVHGH